MYHMPPGSCYQAGQALHDDLWQLASCLAEGQRFRHMLLVCTVAVYLTVPVSVCSPCQVYVLQVTTTLSLSPLACA